jgi:hypothetical protein
MNTTATRVRKCADTAAAPWLNGAPLPPEVPLPATASSPLTFPRRAPLPVDGPPLRRRPQSGLGDRALLDVRAGASGGSSRYRPHGTPARPLPLLSLPQANSTCT